MGPCFVGLLYIGVMLLDTVAGKGQPGFPELTRVEVGILVPFGGSFHI